MENLENFYSENNIKSENIGLQHINQFNALFDNLILENVIVKTPPMLFKGFKMSFENLEVHKPLSIKKNILNEKSTILLPKECREQNLTYGGRMFIKVKLEYKGKILYNDYREVGLLPIMVRSNLCYLKDETDENFYKMKEDPREPGGYFIVSGYDKLVRFHVAMKRNYLFGLKKKDKDVTYSDYSVVIRSVGEDEIGQKNEIKYCADGNIHIKLYLNKKIFFIPIVLIMRALINTTDAEIYEILGCDKRILTVFSKMKGFDVFSQKEALEYLGTKFFPILRIENKEECGRELIKRVILIHLDKFEDKFNLIIEAIKKLLKIYDKKIQPDNIDSPDNFELLTEAQLFPICFREKLEEIKKSLTLRILNVLKNRVSTNDSTTSLSLSEVADIGENLSDIQLEKVEKIFTALDFSIGDKLHKLMATGCITTNSCSDIMQNNGFTIMAERINFWRFSSHFQSVSRGSFFATLKVTSIRKLRPEGWGFFCPINTPDGTPCGLLTHLSRSCIVSYKSLVFDENIIFDFGVIPPSRLYNDGCSIFYNGKLVGYTKFASEVAESLRRYRSINDLCFEIFYSFGSGINESIYVFDSISSLYRPVYNIQTQKKEWIGIKEQIFLNIKLEKYRTKDAFNEYDKEALREDFDNLNFIDFKYKELDNLNMFSSIASCIPFSDHNPSPRNIYQCQMAKQAMGICAYNPQYRTDNKTFTVNYLQQPMVRTSGYSTFENFPIGINCIVAVLSYTAYDMEDAVVINKSANQRGLFSAFIYKTEKYELEKKSFIYYVPKKGSLISTGDTLLKYYNEAFGFKTMKYKGAETGYVDIVRVFQNETPNVTITLRISRTSDIGDKFCSRHGQKGVCSMLWPEIDMPFTESGLRPDLIINPHAFPSRMTIGMLLESMCGKTAVSTCKVQDATPFLKNLYFEDGEESNVDSQKNIGEELKKCGFNYYGNEPMYSGITGTEFKTDIFIGTVYYQRLRHMVNDKYQVRTSGAIVATTHQPVGGRKNKGGIRFGEMEKDALIAHGTTYALKDRLMDCSDKTEFTYCSACKSIMFTFKNGCVCGCRDLKKTNMPYVYKYLCCELMSMNIKLKMDL